MLSPLDPMERRSSRGNMAGYRADYQERAEAGYFLSAPPGMVAEWLQTNWKQPEPGIDSDGWRTDDSGRRLIEYLLARRREPLIDHALARYGYSRPAIQRVYNRGDVSTRYAAVQNPRGGAALNQAQDILRTGKRSLVTPLLQNPNLSSDFLEQLLRRKGHFSDIPDTRFILILYSLTGNKRLSKPYESPYFDGWLEYKYNQVFDAAWDLTRTAPADQKWAAVLSSLLWRANRPPGFKDLEATIERWRVDDPIEEPTWYLRSNSFNLRSYIANFSRADDDLLRSSDAALRMSFYRRFSPWQYKNWPDFLTRDGEEFVNAVLENLELWRSPTERERLERVCWECPDPRHTMDAPNSFRAAQEGYRKGFPTWFTEDEQFSIQRQVSILLKNEERLVELDEKISDLAAKVSIDDSSTSIGDQLEDLREKVDALTSILKETVNRRRGIFSWSRGLV
jgi:hypothetical protein